MIETPTQRLSAEAAEILAQVKAFLGRDFYKMPERWLEAAQRDHIALAKALRDTRNKIDHPSSDPVRSRGGYMWGAFISQEALEKRCKRAGGHRHG